MERRIIDSVHQQSHADIRGRRQNLTRIEDVLVVANRIGVLDVVDLE